MKVIATLSPKAAAAASLLCGKKDVRDYLNGIFVEPREAGGITVTATNGHAMISIVDPDGTCAAPVIVQLEQGTITKCKNQKALCLEILEVPEAESADPGYLARVGGVDAITKCRVIDEKFPAWQQILPATLPASTELRFPCISPTVLLPVLDAALILAGGWGCVSFVHQGPNNSCYVQIKAAAPLTARAVVMPLKSEPLPWEA